MRKSFPLSPTFFAETQVLLRCGRVENRRKPCVVRLQRILCRGSDAIFAVQRGYFLVQAGIFLVQRGAFLVHGGYLAVNIEKKGRYRPKYGGGRIGLGDLS